MTKPLFQRATLATATAALLLAGAFTAHALTVTAPNPPQPGSDSAGGKTVNYTVFVNAFGGGIDVTSTTPGVGSINYETVMLLTCTGAPPSPNAVQTQGNGAPQFFNPIAEGDLTLFCPFFFGSLGQATTAFALNIL